MEENNKTHPKLLSREEVANFLGLKPATLEKWGHTHRCRLKMVKVGSGLRYRVSDTEEFVNDNSTGGSSD